GLPELVTVNWYDKPVCRAETSMTGVSYLGSMNPYPQYIIRDRTHWVFEGLAYNRFGIYMVPGDPIPKSIVGYETDRFQSSDDPCKPNSPTAFKTLAEVPATMKWVGDHFEVQDFNDPNPAI